MRIDRIFRRLRDWINLSINRRLILWSLGFLIIAMAVFSVTVLGVGQSRMTRDTAQRNTQLASIVSRDINAQLSGIFSDSRTFVGHLAAIAPDVTTQAEAALYLRLASPSRYNGIYCFRRIGQRDFPAG